MKIGVFTYNIPHRKTYDVLALLRATGYQDVSVYASPLHYEKKFHPLYEHRPPTTEFIISTKDLCCNLGYKYVEDKMENFSIPKGEVMLICGAGIIPQHIIDNYRIINSHPGYIPNCRGLDAFKWAIYEGQPIGVTTHLLGKYVDAGEIIERRKVPVYYNDSFHSVAQRVYEYEVGMLVNAIKKIDCKHEFILPGDTIIHKRMPHELETTLLECFERIEKQ